MVFLLEAQDRSFDVNAAQCLVRKRACLPILFRVARHSQLKLIACIVAREIDRNFLH